MSSSFLLVIVAMALLRAVLGAPLPQEVQHRADRDALLPPYVQHRIDMDALVPPYVDAFGAHRVTIRVSFPQIRRAMLGAVYPANLTQDSPGVLLLGLPLTSGKFYSLITVDPDAPSPARPDASNVLHFLVTNIPGSISPTEDVKSVGDVVDPWIGPRPPAGTHRYMFLLFDQGYVKCNVTPHVERGLFSVRNFTSTFNLGYPIGGTLFRVSATKNLDSLD